MPAEASLSASPGASAPPWWRRWRSRRVEVHDESMQPALRAGDRLLVDTGAYGHRPPAVGEVVVFVDPAEPSRWLIKRVAAVGPGRFSFTPSGWVPVREGGPPASPPKSATNELVLSASSVYVIGDDPRGRDSRIFGPIDRTALIGRAYRRYAPLNRRSEL
jgi:signal peptidase I